MPFEVKRGASATARFNGDRHLNHGASITKLQFAQGSDHPSTYAVRIAKRVAKGENRHAGFEPVGISEFQNRQIFGIDLNQGQVTITINGENAVRSEAFTIRKANRKITMLPNDVKIGGDDPITRNYETCAPPSFSAHSIDAFNDDDRGLDQGSELFEVLRFAFGQGKFGKFGGVLLLGFQTLKRISQDSQKYRQNA